MIEQLANLMRRSVVEVSDVIVDLVSGKPFPAELTLHRELAHVEDNRKFGINNLVQTLVGPFLDSVTLDHVGL